MHMLKHFVQLGSWGYFIALSSMFWRTVSDIFSYVRKGSTLLLITGYCFTVTNYNFLFIAVCYSHSCQSCKEQLVISHNIVIWNWAFTQILYIFQKNMLHVSMLQSPCYNAQIVQTAFPCLFNKHGFSKLTVFDDPSKNYEIKNTTPEFKIYI